MKRIIKNKNNKATKIISILKRVYSVITVVTTLLAFLGVFLFLCGKLLLGDKCDDDLTMQRIKKQMPTNLTITDIYMEDIHGFGNESLIILASNLDVGHNIANQLLIFDKIENNILNQIYNLFGYGSNYKCSYSFSLQNLDEKWLMSFYPQYKSLKLGYSLKIVDMLDLTGDMSKEIVVKFMPLDDCGSIAGNGGYYDTGIFSYSYEKNNYYLLGTYPPYNDDRIPQKTTFDRNSYNKLEEFKLEGGLDKFYNEFFMKKNFSSDIVLVRTKVIWDYKNESYTDPHRYNISVFEPTLNNKENILNWKEIFSKDTNKNRKDCSRGFVEEFLKRNNI